MGPSPPTGAMAGPSLRGAARGLRFANRKPRAAQRRLDGRPSAAGKSEVPRKCELYPCIGKAQRHCQALPAPRHRLTFREAVNVDATRGWLDTMSRGL